MNSGGEQFVARAPGIPGWQGAVLDALMGIRRPVELTMDAAGVNLRSRSSAFEAR